MKRFIGLWIGILIIASSGSLFADTWTSPATGITYTYTDNTGGTPSFIQNELDPYVDKVYPLDQFAGATATSQAYSSVDVGSFQAYHNYRFLAITVGVQAATHVPTTNLDKLPDYFADMGDTEDPSYEMGFAAATSLNVGVKILPRLYIDAKLMYLPTVNVPVGEDMNMGISNLTVGAGVTWQFMKAFDVGAFRWGGLALHGGYYMTWNKIDFTMKKVNLDDGTVSSTSDFNLAYNAHTHSIPAELTTSIRLVWFLNLYAGVGVTFNFGKATVTMDQDMEVTDGGASDTISFDAESTNNPGVFDVKFMTGLGIKILPVIIDIPVTFHFPTNEKFRYDNKSGMGMNVGITMGVVF